MGLCGNCCGHRQRHPRKSRFARSEPRHVSIMYGPPPDCKRFEVERSNSLRKCIRPLSGESFSGHSMMIRACRSLSIRRSLGTHYRHQVFRQALDCCFVSFSPQQTLVKFISKLRRRGGGKVESVLCFPSAASFPRPILGCSYLQPLVLIVFAAGQHGPGHASQLVGNRDNDFVARCS